MVSNQPYLPVELTEHILGCLWNSGDTPALKSCALASHQFLSISRSLTFSSIVIEHKYDLKQVHNLAQVLRHSPGNLASYIRSFTLLDRSPIMRLRAPEPTETQELWTSEDLATVLSELTHVKTLRIRSAKSQKWSRFPDSLKEGLTSVFHLPSLEVVDLSGMEEIPHSVLSFTAIRSIQLTRCGFVAPTAPYTNVESKPPTRIQDLRVSAEISPRQWLIRILEFILHPISPIKASHLTTIHFLIKNDTGNSLIMRVLAECRHSLQFLHLDVTEFLAQGDLPCALERLSFTGLNQLRGVQLRVKLHNLGETSAVPVQELFPISVIATLLSTIPSDLRGPLECLTLGFFNTLSVTNLSQNQDWEALDEALCSLVTAGPGVVRIRVHYLMEQANLDLLRQCLRKCNGTGRLIMLEDEEGITGWRPRHSNEGTALNLYTSNLQ